MAQIAHPISDTFRDTQVVDQAGGTSSLFATIDEGTASDSDYIKLPFSNGGNTKVLVVRLTSLSDPQSSTGHIVHWRLGENAFSGGHAKIEIRQSYVDESNKGTLIATTATFNTSGADTFTDGVTYTLSGGEADAITDYTALYARIVFTNDNNFAETRLSFMDFQTPDALISGSGTLVLTVAFFAGAGVGVESMIGTGSPDLLSLFSGAGIGIGNRPSQDHHDEGRLVLATVDGDVVAGAVLRFDRDGHPVIAIELYVGNTGQQIRWSQEATVTDAILLGD
jgi:hypothetical protein